MTTATSPTATSCVLRDQSGREVALTIGPPASDALASVAHLQGRQPGAVVAEIVFTAIVGRLQSTLTPARLTAGVATGGAAQALVSTGLLDGLFQVAAASGQHAGAYGADLVAEYLLGASRLPVNTFGSLMFGSDDAKVQTWLPGQAHIALKEVAEHLGMTASDVVRNCVFLHLYGRLAFEQAVKAGKWSPSRRYDDMSFSDIPHHDGVEKQKAPRTELIEMIGKAQQQFTVYMPTALRVQLWATAEHAGFRASEYLRRHLVTYVLGRLAADALPLQARA